MAHKWGKDSHHSKGIIQRTLHFFQFTRHGGGDGGHGPRLASPLHSGWSKNNTLPYAPIQGIGSQWFVTYLFSKIMAYCRAWCNYCCIICSTLKEISKKNELYTYCTHPKKQKNEPEYITKLLPISLGNVVSWIISKVFANSLKPILPNVISNSQSAFVPSRIITDNTTVAFEMLNRMRNRAKEKKGHIAVKLDINKAYDRVEWEFLQRMMQKIGLPNQWVNLAMEIVRDASYSTLINGEPGGLITPTCGIKQGDPLSLYLFLICVEGLSSLIRRAIDRNLLKEWCHAMEG